MRRVILTVLACLLAGNAMAQTYRQAGDWIVRGGIGVVAPDGDGADLAPGATVDVDDGYAATITVAYMVTDHIGVELLASTPFNHDIDLTGAGTVAETDQLPPTLSLQYHFGPFGRIQPYVGAGVNYTIFFNEETKGALNGTTLNLDDSVGLAGQLGFDWHFGNNWLANIDVRYISIETDAEIGGQDVGGPGIGNIKLDDVEVDPWVFSVNVGYNF
jgi:outer membrane protein